MAQEKAAPKNSGYLFSIEKQIVNTTRERIGYAAILCLSLLAYYLIYADKMFPYTEGWGIYYVELIRQGMVPYRDFYFYLPPLNLLIDNLFWTLSGGLFIVYRLLRLLERVLMLVLIYCALTKYFKAHTVWFACIVGGILGGYNAYDLMGDYTQTAELLLVLVGIFAGNFLNTSGKKKYGWLAVCGFTIGCAMMMKQPHGVAAIILCFAFLSFFCIIEKDRKFGYYCLATLCGIVIPIAACTIWLMCNNAFWPFIDQVFVQTGSKGSLADILVNTWKSLFLGDGFLGSIYIIDLIALIILLHAWQTNTKQASRPEKVKKGIAIIASGYFFYYRYASLMKPLAESMAPTVKYAAICLACTTILLLFLLDRFLPRFKNAQQIVWLAAGTATLAAIAMNWRDIAFVIDSSSCSTVIESLMHLVVLGCVGILLYTLFLRAVQKTWRMPLGLIGLITLSVASCYATIMAAVGSGMPSRSMFLCIPILICILCQMRNQKVWQGVIYALCIFFCVVSLSQKVTGPYSWWGWDDSAIAQKTETTDIPALKGFKFSKQEKEIYEETCKLITENSEENDTVLCIPHTPVFNILTNRIGMNGFVPVTFFDVCADVYAEEEALLLLDNPPEIIVWCDLDVSCWNVHEKYFRKGARSGQRDIQEWMFSEVSKGNYRLIGQVRDLFIYKWDDGTPVRYEFYENKSAENRTLMSNSLRKYDYTQAFKGKGTAESPYQIDDLWTLCTFRDAVNAGETFAGTYFVQTCDIDLEEIEHWEPIGHLSTGKYFAGVYDGAGYSIMNMTIQSKGNSAFFGYLSGQVYNLSIVDCAVSGGDCNAALVSHSRGTNAKIVNCYTSGLVSSRARSGGIADNFLNGTIANCYSKCELETTWIRGSIVSYGAERIMYCILDENAHLDRMRIGSLYQCDETNDVLQALNDGIEQYAQQYGDERISYRRWKKAGDDSSYCISQSETIEVFRINETVVVIVILITLICITGCQLLLRKAHR